MYLCYIAKNDDSDNRMCVVILDDVVLFFLDL